MPLVRKPGKNMWEVRIQLHRRIARILFKMNTSRSALDRLLDPRNTSVTLQTLERAAHAIGKRLRIDFA